MKAVLTYHVISDLRSPIAIHPDAFLAHARWLSSGCVRVLSLDDLVAHPVDGPDAVAVTFDDGLQCAGVYIESLLAAGVPVTIFVVTGHVGGTNRWGGAARPDVPTLPLLGWADLERLTALGATVGAHTRTHPALSGVSIAALDDELGGCLEDVRVRLGVECAHVAYPYGDVNDGVAARAARYYRWGHTTDFRVVASGDTALRLPRLDMYYFGAPGVLESWGRARFSRHVAWCRLRRTLRRYLGARSR